jgi:hypothetical protein
MRTFTYLLEGYNKMEFPFRVGDVVKVNDFGATYTGWSGANLYFTNKLMSPFYSIYYNKRDTNIPFKIKGIISHPNYRRVVCYLEDRDKNGIIIGAQALRVVRQYPLRKGESDTILLKKVD